MSFTTVTSRGRITVPAKYRREMNISPGDKVEFYKDHLGFMGFRKLEADSFSLPAPDADTASQADLASDAEAMATAISARHDRAFPKKYSDDRGTRKRSHLREPR